MILLKLQFCNAKGLVLNRRTFNTLPYAVTLLITPDDIISIEMSSNKTSDINFLYYDIEPWKLSIKYDSILSILNEYGHPNSMDLTGILWLFMCYIKYDTTEYPVFIDMSTIDWSVLNNIITFSAYSIVGVVFLYDKIKPSIYLQDQLLLIIPRNIKPYFDNDPYIILLPNYNYSNSWVELFNYHQRYFTMLIGTAVLNIFSRNNLGEQYNTFWEINGTYPDLTVIPYKNYFANIDRLNTYYFMKSLPINYSTRYAYTPYNVSYIDFYNWNTYIYNAITINNNIINVNPSNISIEDNSNYNSDELAYGSRRILGFIKHPNGWTFINLITRLVNVGYFNMLPFIMTNIDDTATLQLGQPVIGVTQWRPNWIPSTSQYYWRDPAYDNERRILAIYYRKYLVVKIPTGNTPYMYCKIYKRTATYTVDTNKPSAVNLLVDSGWEYSTMYRYTAEVESPDEFWKSEVWDGSLVEHSDDFFTTYAGDSLYGIGLYSVNNSGIIERIALSMEDVGSVVINTTPVIDKILFKKNIELLNTYNGISNIDIIKQSLLLMNASFIYSPTNGKSLYTNKMAADGFPTSFSEIYTIALDDVEQYKYIPYIKTKPKNIYELYGAIVLNPYYNVAVRSFYNNIINSIKVKITMNVIGDITSALNMIDFRYFYFQDRIFILTSVKYDTQNNVTNILGFGK